MERYNFLAIEKKWRERNLLTSSVQNIRFQEESFTAWKCFHTHLAKFTWAMSEIILLGT